MKPLAVLPALALSSALALPAHATATIVIQTTDGAGEGFNDPSPRSPVGGNTGTTLGQQRLIAFQAAADIWGEVIDSDVPIVISAAFDPLSCTASSAVLGSAGATLVGGNFANVPLTNTWYPIGLANSLAGSDLAPAGSDITATFNVNLGGAGCLAGVGWYLGLDDNHGTDVDLVTVLLHEFAHGLGFATFMNETTGVQFGGFPDAFDSGLLDLTTGLTFPAMSNAQRVTASKNSRNVVWTGAEASEAAGLLLNPGSPFLTVTAPALIAGGKLVGTADFGPPLTGTPISATVVQALDGSGTTTDACSAITNGGAISGTLALVDRGTCDFTTKAKNVQNAGALGMILVQNTVSSPPPELYGEDATVTIPSISILQADGAAIKARLTAGNTVNATVGLDMTRQWGTDTLDRGFIYTPSPVEPGSSVSHWDIGARPNLLMEPAINDDLGHDLDLTLPLLLDIGWPVCHEASDCTDSDACNGVEACTNFDCVAGAPPDCSESDPCIASGCDPGTGCYFAAEDDGLSCADSTVCNGDETCQAGSCTVGAAPNCDDNNACTAEACDAVLGCSSTAVSAGISCGGGGTCNGAGVCAGAKCLGVKLTSASPGPLPSGTATQFTATNFSCGSGQTPEFRFQYKRDGGPSSYTVFRDWDDSADAFFDNTGLPSGKYTFQVQARHVGNTKSSESSATKVVLSGNVCTAVTLGVTPGSPRAPGTDLNLSSTATCTEGGAEYLFEYKPKSSSVYSLLRTWGPGSYVWETDGLTLGDYNIRVSARGAGNTTKFESQKSSPYSMTDFCHTPTVTVLPSSPVAAGVPVTVQAESVCDAGGPGQFLVRYRPKGTSTWIELQPYDTDSSEVWPTSGLTPGNYEIRVDVRATGASSSQGYKTITYKLL